MRMRSHKLAIENGRYTLIKNPKRERLCTVCNSGEIEDEEHFLLNFNAYRPIRHVFGQSQLIWSRFAYSHFAYSRFAYSHFAYSCFAYPGHSINSRFAYSALFVNKHFFKLIIVFNLCNVLVMLRAVLSTNSTIKNTI